MNARIGSKLENVPTRRILTPKDYYCLIALLAISFGIRAWLIAHTSVTARDGIEFARIALNLMSPRELPSPDPDRKRSLADVVKATVHPPVYPLVIVATSQIVRIGSTDDVPTRMLRSAQIASLVGSLLMVFPTYWLGRTLFSSRFVGFAGAAFFQTLPTVSHVTSDALSESWFILFGSISLLFAIRGIRRWSTLMFLFAGAFAALSYLVRPEGIMFLLATILGIAGLGILRIRPRIQSLGRLTALTVGFMICASPYMWIIKGVSNKPTAKTMIDTFLEKIFGALNKQPQGVPVRPNMGQLPAPMRQLPAPMGQPQQAPMGQDKVPKGEVLAPVGSPMLFAAWNVKDNPLVGPPLSLFKETLKSCHYGVFVLGLLGLFLQRRRLLADPGFMLLGLFGIINAAVLLAVGKSQGYISERHTLMLVLLTCIFAASAMEPLADVFGLRSRRFAVGLLLLLLCFHLPSALKPSHAGRTGHPHAGRYLAAHVGPDDAVIDPFSWAEWYAGRTNYAIPVDPAAPKIRWAILEPGNSPHSNLPRYQAAVDVKNDLENRAELVYWWPEDVAKADAPNKAKVVVYRQVVK